MGRIERSHLYLFKEIIPSWNRLSRRNTNHFPPHSIRRTHSLNPSTKILHSSLHRHSSHTSLLQGSPSQVDPPVSASQGFRRVLEAPNFHASAAWDAYTSIQKSDTSKPLTEQDILVFAEKIASSIENLYQYKITSERMREWGFRIQGLLDQVKTPVLGHRRNCLSIRALAMQGDVEQAMRLARKLHTSLFIDESGNHSMGDVLICYESIVKSISLHQDAPHVLDFITQEWQILASHMMLSSSKIHGKGLAQRSRSLRLTVHDILETIPDPVQFLSERKGQDADRRLRAGELLIDVLCTRNLANDALLVLAEMTRQLLRVSVDIQLTLVRALVSQDNFESANHLFSSLDATFSKSGVHYRSKYYLSTGLYLFAHQGDATRAEDYWNRLVRRGWVSGADKAMMLQAHAVNGNTSEVMGLWDQFFRLSRPSNKHNAPTIVHYTIAVYAYAQCGDFDGMNAWLEEMSTAGIVPDEYVYTIVIKSFAKRGRVDSVATVLNQMRAAGIQPTVKPYTVAIALLAQRRDPVGAEELYKRAISEGIVPDRHMITSLMNAHVEAASWQGVIRAFDYLKSSSARHVRLSIEVYNTLLKAYVLIGAPFEVVSKLFGKLESARVRPDAHTFALLVQSACDAGLMNIASGIFEEMEKLAEHWESRFQITVYVLTIIMSGFLRIGDKVRAKAAYDEMKARGIQPTSVTFSTILRAYGNENTEESIRIARDFLKELTDPEKKARPWLQGTGGRMLPLDDVYSPLMNVYAKKVEPEEVERLFKEMLETGGEPTLGTLSALLYAYSQKADTEAVLELWPQIFQLGLRHSQTGVLFKTRSMEGKIGNAGAKRQANILCIPLSIYINALSAANLHLEIATVWNEMKVNGFVFDSHNWNHLAVALVRAGEPERAFEVVEKVLLPFQRRSLTVLSERDETPETPLSFDEEPTEDLPKEPPFEGPGHNRERRAATAKIIRRKTKGGALITDPGHEDDFAHPLHLLHQKSTPWTIWRVHGGTLTLLGRVLSRLESGEPIQPVGCESREILTESEAADRRKAIRNRSTDILERIYNDFPNAIQAVKAHEWRVARNWDRH